ncbi:MAG: hypothetical protein FWD71_04730 [Oscillospiraceae bacterium]|nr:hypothetical protein [Oscillospiraceae bacterium]
MFITTKEKSIRQKNIIGIFDLDNATVSSVTKNFLSAAEKASKITGTDILPKSFILTNSNNIFNRLKNIKRNKSNNKKSDKSKKSNDFKIYFSSHVSGHISK